MSRPPAAVHRVIKAYDVRGLVGAEIDEQFVADVDEANSMIVWGAPDAQNWYKNGRGRVSQNWPHSLLEYWRRTREPAVEDYLFQ